MLVPEIVVPDAPLVSDRGTVGTPEGKVKTEEPPLVMGMTGTTEPELSVLKLIGGLVSETGGDAGPEPVAPPFSAVETPE
jgi:hypothetical protein